MDILYKERIIECFLFDGWFLFDGCKILLETGVLVYGTKIMQYAFIYLFITHLFISKALIVLQMHQVVF